MVVRSRVGRGTPVSPGILFPAVLSRANANEWTDVAVVGAGIGGLTAAALLADAGLRVLVLEAHSQSGGCAGTFRRQRWTFDVGATQVAGLEPGGIHGRLFAHLGVEAPAADRLDPACVVHLPGEREGIPIWLDRRRWAEERLRQFPGSQRFWRLCGWLQQASWNFAGRDPVLPPRTPWDLSQLLAALRPDTLASGLFTRASVADLLRLCSCSTDRRLRQFLDLQLKLYSQEPAERTAALYGATVLAMAQQPLGLWHLQGSMQVLSDCLERALGRAGGVLRCGRRVTGLQAVTDGWQLQVEKAGPRSQSAEPRCVAAHQVVLNLPVQNLPELLGDQLPAAYRRRVEHLPEGSGALVLYGAVPRHVLPRNCPVHLQLLRDGERPMTDANSLFVSVSSEGDGRAPEGEATVIASSFTSPGSWQNLDRQQRQARKLALRQAMHEGLETLLGIRRDQFLHSELATPRAFAHYTGRRQGIVGGLAQRPELFGPFGFSTRLPLPAAWLVGDSVYPGEGTAGVSLAAVTLARQLLRQLGRTLVLPDRACQGNGGDGSLLLQ